MRFALLFTVAMAITSSAPAQLGPAQRLELPVEQRLDVPLQVGSSSLKLTEFVNFVATSFKVPLLVEVPVPVARLKSPAGKYSARQLLNIAVRQLPGFAWRDVGGVAHIYDKQLLRSPGNLMNLRLHRFAYSKDVAETLFLFRACVGATIKGFGCESMVTSGFALPVLKQGGLKEGLTFHDTEVRVILLNALKENGHFWVVVGFEGTQPKLQSEFPFAHWYNESLEVDEAHPFQM